MQVVSGDTRELLNNFVDDPTPQGSGIDEHVVLVDQGEMAASSSCTGEGVTDDPLHSEGGIDATAPLSSQG